MTLIVTSAIRTRRESKQKSKNDSPQLKPLLAKTAELDRKKGPFCEPGIGE